MHYNFARPHQTFAKDKRGRSTTPATGSVSPTTSGPHGIAALLD
ncbi:hypothetical protein PP533_15890 [Mycobacteroides abscessus]|nr:hypothetical protein [Mycobacteroides abscessus]MDM2349435.1 hypothetical protein [Mycobacteroides abscessus]MDM2357739.1 hypothetical protein [Mycobacteroides abscessus]